MRALKGFALPALAAGLGPLAGCYWGGRAFPLPTGVMAKAAAAGPACAPMVGYRPRQGESLDPSVQARIDAANGTSQVEGAR
ncbi:MAG: hypothetical protein C4315_09245 [Chloroflexota bacterium]